MWELYKRHPGFVLGFHGCDQAIGEKVLSGRASLKTSTNDYDWLGPGTYFWEGNPERALQFATEAATRAAAKKTTRGVIRKPFVVGAVIDLGLCCNLLDSAALAELKKAHSVLTTALDSIGTPHPENRGSDLGQRNLDCAVITTMQRVRADEGLQAYDTVRGAFWEGGALYPGAGFSAKGHIQIAVVNHDCIRGYFRPIQLTTVASKARKRR